MRTMVLVYLATKLGDFVRVNVGIHIPAPWSIWVIDHYEPLLIMVQAFIIGGLDLEDLENWRDPAWMRNCRLR